MIYDIYLLQLVFHPVAAVGRLVQNQERDKYIPKENQYTKQYKTTKQKTKQKKHENKILKNVSLVNKKKTKNSI